MVRCFCAGRPGRCSAGILIVLFLLLFPIATEAAEPGILQEVIVIRSPGAGPGVAVQHEMLVWNFEPETVERIELPVISGAVDVQGVGETEGMLRWEEGRLIDPRPLAPGEQRIYQLTYSVPVPSVPLVLQRRLPYPVVVTDFWIEERFRLTGIGVALVEQGVVEPDLGEGRFDHYEMFGERVSDRWQVVVEPVVRRSGLPVLGGHAFHSDPGTILAGSGVLWIVLAGVGLAAVAAVYRMRSSRDEGPPGDAAPVDAREAHLKDMIVELDLLHRRGGVPDEEYRERRAALKEELLRHLAGRKRGVETQRRHPEVQSDA